MPLSFLNKVEISERMIPAYFILFAVKFAFCDVFTGVAGYRYATFLPAGAWAVLFLTFGILQLAATCLRYYKFRLIMLFISSSVWLLWAGFIVAAQVQGLGDVIWSLIAVMSFLTYFRVRHAPLKR